MERQIEEYMEEKGYKLPSAPVKGGIYSRIKEISPGIFYFSGCGSDNPFYHLKGRVGSDITLDQGREGAKNAMLNVLALIKEEFGNLDCVESFLKILVFVSSGEKFYDQPQVADGATLLLRELWGEERGLPTRSAVGVYVLPGNIPVEVEGIFRIVK